MSRNKYCTILCLATSKVVVAAEGEIGLMRYVVSREWRLGGGNRPSPPSRSKFV
jgi:hypothetical protein